ncbi:MAG TPA: septum site-determining protein MinC [Burkholderiaceae bacterium]|nr:septum site-determining protein MinC [Burkholderiaceae bacterium]
MHASTTRAPVVFELKSASLALIAVLLKTSNIQALAEDIAQRVADTPNFFDDDPVMIDLAALRDSPEPIDFPNLVALLRDYRMRPVAVRNGNDAQTQAAQAIGLSRGPDSMPTNGGEESEPAHEQGGESSVTQTSIQRAIASGDATFEVHTAPTLVIDKPLRSGQRVYARGGDVVVLDLVSFDAEVIADGSIHVYAPLRGKAVAGARGDANARIFTTCLEPQLVSIAGIYRTTETQIPEDVLGKAAQIRLVGERLVMEPLGR